MATHCRETPKGRHFVRIAVVGTIMRDEIETDSGEKLESFGGILYNVVALAALTRGSDRIVPVCSLGADHFGTVTQRYFGDSRHVQATGVHASAGGTDENVITYGGAGDRTERMTIRTEPLTPAQLEPAKDCTAILINFVNGRELGLETLRAFRASSSAHIHLDVHNLGKRIDESGTLVRGEPADWKEWLALVDTVQANEWEVAAMLGSRPETGDEFRAAATGLLGAVENLRVAIVTGGANGATIAHRLTGDRSVRTMHVPVLPVDAVKDTTGCGDCFAAGFVVGMQRHRNPLRAALVATVLSGLNAIGGGPEDIPAMIRRIEPEIRKHYRELDARIASGFLGDEANPVP